MYSKVWMNQSKLVIGCNRYNLGMKTNLKILYDYMVMNQDEETNMRIAIKLMDYIGDSEDRTNKIGNIIPIEFIKRHLPPNPIVKKDFLVTFTVRVIADEYEIAEKMKEQEEYENNEDEQYEDDEDEFSILEDALITDARNKLFYQSRFESIKVEEA